MLQGPKGQQCHAPRHSSQPASKCLILPQPKTRATLDSDTCKASCHSKLCDYEKPSANLPASFIQNPWRAWVRLNMILLFTSSPASQTTTFRPSTSDSSPFSCEPSFPWDVLVSPDPQNPPPILHVFPVFNFLRSSVCSQYNGWAQLATICSCFLAELAPRLFIS